MADPQTPDLPDAPSLSDVAAAVVDSALDPVKLGKAGKFLENLLLEVARDGTKLAWLLVQPFFETFLKAVLAALEAADPALDDIGKIAVDAVLGERPKRGYIPDDVGRRIIDKLAPASATVEPSIAGAQQYLTMITHLQMEAWLLGFVTELFGESADWVRGAGGQIHSIAELREVITQVFGGARITRRVLAPFIDDGIVAPAKRWTARKYRPQLLSVAATIEAYLRGDWDITRLNEESSQQGWSDERLDVLVENARKRITLDELFFDHYRGKASDVDVAGDARALGYDPATTLRKLEIDGAKRIDDLNRPVVAEAITNYIAGDIGEADMTRWVRGAAPNPTDAERMISTAKARHAINIRRLTIAELRALVKDKIASVADFRRRLEHDGYDPESVTWLELQLRFELDTAKSIAQHRAELDAERATEKAQRDAAKSARDAEVATKKARAQFPPLADYRRGYVSGLIDRDALADALTRDGIVQDQDLYLGDADLDREAYLAAQAARALTTAKAAASGLSIAQLEESVLRGVLTVADFDANLTARHMDDADRRVLTELLQLKVNDRAAAEVERAAAETRAQLKGASHADWTRAVRLGVRTTAQYAAFLDSIGTTAVPKALLLDLLNADLVQDKAAAAKRAARDAEAATKGISLDERRRAVIAGLRPRTWYSDALVKLDWPVDDQLADLQLLDVEIANAASAQAKRDELAKKADTAILSLSQLDAAFKLGLLTGPELLAALRARKYSDADANMLLQIAVLTLPNTHAGQVAETAPPPPPAPKPAPLGDLKQLVLRGLRSSDDYEAELQARGYSADAAALMRDVVDSEKALDYATVYTKVAAVLATRTDAPTLDELITALGSGELLAADLIDWMDSIGIPREVGTVIARLKGRP